MSPLHGAARRRAAEAWRAASHADDVIQTVTHNERELPHPQGVCVCARVWVCVSEHLSLCIQVAAQVLGISMQTSSKKQTLRWRTGQERQQQHWQTAFEWEEPIGKKDASV